MTSNRRAQARALKFGQHLALAGAQMIFGALTGAIRLVRGSHPEGWRTLRYGLHRDEVLDHMEPNAHVTRRRPVVFFHGGGWMMGTKDFYSHDLLFLAAAGHPVFNVEYPKAPDHPHPWMLRSVFRALAFIRQTFPDGGAVHLAGDSAGGNLAMMAGILASNPELLAVIEPDAGEAPQILSCVSLYGVLDRLTCLNPNTIVGPTMIEAYGGGEALKETVDAAHAITPMDLKFARHPPCFLSCGEWDPLLASQELYAKHLAREGHAVTTKTYAKATHGYFNVPEGAVKSACHRDMTAFLREVEDSA